MARRLSVIQVYRSIVLILRGETRLTMNVVNLAMSFNPDFDRLNLAF